MRSDGPASGRATCTARSAALGQRGRPARGSGGGGPCRSRASGRDLRELLPELEPAVVVELIRVDDGVEDPTQRHAFALPSQLGADGVDRQRPDARADRLLVDLQLDRDLAVLRCQLESRVEGGLEVVDVLEREVQARGDAAEHEVSHLAERLLSRNRECDLVSGHDALSTNARAGYEVSAGSGRAIAPEPTTAPSSS